MANIMALYHRLSMLLHMLKQPNQNTAVQLYRINIILIKIYNNTNTI